ncbi:hypothetical protein [Metamycoplasma neophronis]|uniref:HipA-like kinase domain-containing protein n=1 Tax=Metamycoplasma neophronis TaxID=872983 RepID=A0ABY2Z096_9BACT|nr:hypothetical protein [Metamycoplasma neophronis]TPR53693.1 hypothetical protein FJR74_02210 [Metamycoplasma neophronis]
MSNLYYLKFLDKNCLSFKYDYESKTLSDVTMLEAFDFLIKKSEVYSIEDWKEFLFNDNIIPNGRPNYSNLFKNIKSNFELIKTFKRINFSDAFWITDNLNDKFENLNWFDNFVKNDLSEFTLSRKLVCKTPFEINSPDWFTDGQMLKTWIKQEGIIKLLKSPNFLAGKLLYENFAEYFAGQIAALLLKKSVVYDLDKWNKKIVTSCSVFTSKQVSYLPFSKLITKTSVNQNQLEEFLITYYGKENFEDLMVFDALILNSDRHLGNFGMLLNNQSCIFEDIAPVFDFNKSLFFDFPLYEQKQVKKQLEEYSKRASRLYQSFDEQLIKFARPRHLTWVDKLKKFRLKQHPLYECNKTYFKVVQTIIKEQAKKLERHLNNLVK